MGYGPASKNAKPGIMPSTKTVEINTQAVSKSTNTKEIIVRQGSGSGAVCAGLGWVERLEDSSKTVNEKPSRRRAGRDIDHHGSNFTQ